jgi:hypothetical protein
LDLEKNQELHYHLADAWVRITQGGEKQRRVHRHHSNFTAWNMENGDYAVKYAQKADQKDVPGWFRGVGRFWGCSYNMIPEGQLFTDEGIIATTAHHVIPWELASFSKFAHKVFRRYHEKKMNCDRSGERRRNKKGEVQNWRKSPIVRFSCGEYVPGRFHIPEGRKILDQLLGYIIEYGPDVYSLRAGNKERVPF